VTDRASVPNAVSTAVAATGRLDAVVHKATSGAASQPHQLESVDDALWEDHVSVFLRGANYCAQAAFEALSACGGTLVVMISAAGIKGSAILPLYSMMKGGLLGFAKRSGP
jgi:NAD(P)-dependent dehydrogenase (short-subunit alcohol dehydrogenase family)